MKAGTNLNHVAGEYEDGVQRCVICEGIIVDDRGVMRMTGDGPAPRGFVKGPVFMSGNCTGVGREDSLPDYKPSS
jgi:hypothetical protein